MTARAIALALVLAAAAHAAPPAPRAFHLENDMNLPGALQSVGYQFFQPPAGTLLSIEKLHEHPLPHHSTAFEKYRVSSPGGAVLGDFLRMQVHHKSSTTLDVALIVQDGRVVRARPLRPVVMDGQPLLDFHEVLATLKERRAREYAHPLSAVFHALAALERTDTTKPAKPLTDAQVKEIVDKVRAQRPPRPPASPPPAFATRDEAGAPFDPSRLAGHRSLVAMATVQSPVSRRVLEWLHRYAAEHAGRFAVFEVILNRPPVIAQYRRRGGTFAGVVVPDPTLVVYDAFKAALSPCMYVYGADGKLAAELAPPFTTYEELAGRLDAVP